ncbi:uncharacterized protein KY384_002418 [Bacidia gigantensis]|uniref:uncharacterized protein n=1 Tax=Bacidia gigantensis TaxID=2732470 RepID=UPI001D04CE0C|nr:uncharacterized protein KY384_002418 [Bacidia gigantensis]KAG8532541.1 hypothetical protein KY384_002418 [Bacidia gigantensis]
MTEKASFLEAYSPWPSRSTTPKPAATGQEKKVAKDDSSVPSKSSQTLQDHATTHRYYPSSKDYPRDCPRLNTRWFYATDAPKAKAQYANTSKDHETLPKPKKYSAFSYRDSYAIEKAFSDLVEKEALERSKTANDAAELGHKRSQSLADVDLGEQGNDIGPTTSSNEASIKVPVNEDFLFDVDIKKRELGPAYWLGPIYGVRRGSWFYQEGSNLRPCDENLAGQLEQGYLKVKPWQNPPDGKQSREPSPKPKPGSEQADSPEKDNIDGSSPKCVTDGKKEELPVTKKFELQTQRLFGSYMNSVVTYQDGMTAWLLTDDFLSRMSSTVYQRFAGGGHLGGVKVVRGFKETSKGKDGKKDEEDSKRKSAVPEDTEPTPETSEADKEDPSILKLEKQMSNLDPEQQEAEARQRDEAEIKDGYKQAEGEDQEREIEHLVLVTHGIGQKLGMRLEMLNFIADVNTLRKNIKAVYGASPDLQLLNSEMEKPENSRIQVLPIVWRHLLDFPKQSYKSNREQDLADTTEEDEYPSLENITLEPPTIIRTAIRDLGLDILMYQSAYREHISEIVVRECNRVYDSFKQRNPEFRGKVSLLGHSLGSAILFDVLCHQKDPNQTASRSRNSSLNKRTSSMTSSSLELNFEVEDYYCLGSPLGLYQMLNGRKIVGRRPLQSPIKSNSPLTDDPFLAATSTDPTTTSSNSFAISASSPKCAQLFNIFHPADPIAYRIEPLISTAMAELKPQPLPYTKRGILDIQGQGLSALGNRVGQSVSGLWSSVTSGMASSLLNRTLGLPPDAQTQAAVAATPVIQTKPDAKVTGSEQGKAEEEAHEPPPTLIDEELETLYAGFEKSRKLTQSDESRDLGESSQWAEAEQKAKRLKREEAKVRALNSNGRVDFSIQPGMFDMTNPMASIASHLSYWSDEDVSHFMVSQLLSRQRVLKR